MNPPLFALHGSFGRGSDWSAVAEQLGRPVLAPDLPGHGARFTQPAESFDATVAELLDQLPPGADLLGYSLGGRLALAVALAATARSLPIRSLVLESAHPGLAGEQAAARAALDDARALQLASDPAAFLEQFYAAPLFASFRSSGLFGATFEERIRLAQRDPAALAATLRALSPGRQPNLAPALAAAKLPTLFVSGALDTKYTELGTELAANSSHIQQAVIAGAGHNVHLEQPIAFAAAARSFWESLP